VIGTSRRGGRGLSDTHIPEGTAVRAAPAKLNFGA
jgi:hypothetical protein